MNTWHLFDCSISILLSIGAIVLGFTRIRLSSDELRDAKVRTLLRIIGPSLLLFTIIRLFYY